MNQQIRRKTGSLAQPGFAGEKGRGGFYPKKLESRRAGRFVHETNQRRSQRQSERHVVGCGSMACTKYSRLHIGNKNSREEQAPGGVECVRNRARMRLWVVSAAGWCRNDGAGRK